jgi:hypothetical protein
MCNGWVGGLRVFVSVRPVQGAFNGGLVSRWVRMGSGLKARPWQSGDPRLSAERLLQQAPDQLAFPISSPPIDPLQGGSGSPSRQHGAIHGEMLLEQPFAVLGGCRRMPDRIIWAEPGEPSERQGWR